MKQLLFLVFAAFLMAACQSSENSNTNTATSPAVSSEQASADSDKPSVNPAHGQPYHDCSIAVGAPLVAKEAPAANVKLNPAHGQPGHRCDIAVGAPLS